MEKIALKYGLLTAIGLIGYFFVMKAIGLSHIVELRFLNSVILTIGIVMTLRGLKRAKKEHFGYLSGLGAAFLTSVVATIIFSAFMLIYIKTFDDSLLTVLSHNSMVGERVSSTPGLVIFMVLMLEGVISGAMIGFIAMQFFKRPDHTVPNSP
ncbi:DUF4199 domain-containing protein [Pontibacter sp. BT310]|jgi:hypothetical protein|uniref:DUF4199 domain-containing protein n=1 Tax=Pontibacter populi TaxID=890055 RepID=A0ABS6XBI2_9BACT|nr:MULTISPECIES: DUF4199 domain-containing protein [Pontibacter]MBJ6117980.1 DUF4199 domain-containing protein [Pontibacter sp. BT310]MBR0570407.1 DUF4199 domain-containing protein [Microvirga sp. STS03]MBW3364833.1 hypothetical protein [Pontibacter populi]